MRTSTRCSLLVAIGLTALSAAACGSSDHSSPAEPSASAPVATSTPAKADGEVRVTGSIASVSGSTIEVTGPGTTAKVAFSPSTRFMEHSAATLTDIRPGLCVTIRPASGAEGGAVTADAVVIGIANSGKCEKTGSADNAGLPSSPLGGFRGTVDAVDDRVITVTTLGTDGSATKSTITVTDTTLFAERHRVGADAVVEGRCIIARGTNDTGGILQARTINLPLAVDGQCPQPKG